MSGMGSTVAVADGGADGFKVLCLLDDFVVAGGVAFADGGGEHVGRAVVDDLFHGGAADFVEGAGPEDELGRGGHESWTGSGRCRSEQIGGEGIVAEVLARAGGVARRGREFFPLALGCA